jgi:hypothetical protein
VRAGGGRRSGGGVKISTRGGPQVPRLGNTFYELSCLLFWWIRQKNCLQQVFWVLVYRYSIIVHNVLIFTSFDLPWIIIDGGHEQVDKYLGEGAYRFDM